MGRRGVGGEEGTNGRRVGRKEGGCGKRIQQGSVPN